MQILTENLIKEIAEQYDISEAETKKVITSVFKFVRTTMTEEPDKSIRLKRFGIFVPKSKYYNKKQKK